MSWLSELFFGQGIAHSVLMFAIVIALGIVLGKVKVWGISLGITWILFVGIICSHLGMRVDGHTLHFMKEFGLILFVYSVGLQVGPGFFSSFRKGGLTLNMAGRGHRVLGRGDHIYYSCCDRITDYNDGRYPFRSSDEYAGIGCCSTSLFGYGRGK